MFSMFWAKYLTQLLTALVSLLVQVWFQTIENCDQERRIPGIFSFIIIKQSHDKVNYILCHLQKCILSTYRCEREAYMKRRSDAALRPDEMMSAIADGMDQSKLGLPHFKGWRKPKVKKILLPELRSQNIYLQNIKQIKEKCLAQYKYKIMTHTVFIVISVPTLISSPPHISLLIELIFLNMLVFKARFYHVLLFRYRYFMLCKCELQMYSLKLQKAYLHNKK